MNLCKFLFVLLLTFIRSAAAHQVVSLVAKPFFLEKAVSVRGGGRNAPGKAKIQPVEPSTEGASIAAEVFNLVKTIVGVGVLSLPAGVAAFGNAPSAAIPAVCIISIIGILSGYGFALIGKCCAYTGATSYRDAWSKTVGEGSSWIPAVSATVKTSLACLSCSMVLGDTFSSIFRIERNLSLLAVTLTALLPLCLLKNLKALAPFSLLGVIGIFYTALAMTIRYLDGSYVLPEGSLGSSLPGDLQPSFGDKGIESVFTSSSLILVCMLSTAYMAHFNAAKFYIELKNNTVPRFHQVVRCGFGISILLMVSMTLLGFLTFGENSSGLVLNNYSVNDSWMSLSRIAVALSLLFSYPLAFAGFRDGVLDMLKVPGEKRTSLNLNILTITLLSAITFLASILRNVSFVLAFGGATFGNALTYVFPALMYRAVVKQQDREDEMTGVNIAMTSAVMGIVMGIIGAKMALKKI
eukprot:CAMPEP_0178938910 /NCGR_PEP_ID=MMETSP0786-20121207/26591_1 /TAXON_ID=186022 /ORGANISM="Thalassionema frauenfeldii, Strain CCMP 1798" /LENGTH=465 /DNA_ID=CAMNT_0020617677 /DNA_START=48 /DNA_END=1445 /DNA_ORIENTATION=-